MVFQQSFINSFGRVPHFFQNGHLNSERSDLISIHRAVIFDQDISFSAHIEHICRTVFCHLRSISKIRIILSQSGYTKPIPAFITSRLLVCFIDYASIK